MDRYLFIINPTAGSGRTRAYVKFIQDYMSKTDKEHKIAVTTKPKEATEMVINSPQYNICVAVGGDGTANEVAKGILQRGYGILGIIPSGTGNDMAQALKLNLDRDKAMERLLMGDTVRIDLGKVRGDYFFNIASVGFDAWVVKETDRIKKLIKGKASYILGVLAGLLTYSSREIEMEIDGIPIRRKATLVAVGNGQSYGGGMKMLPMASIYDDMLDVCVVKDISNLKILFLFPSIFKGEHIKYTKHVEFFKGRNIKVALKQGELLNIDGELFEVEDEVIEFYLSSQKLEVIV
ncbi:diacylglycerol/lipid kinase family protein [Gudongella sp. SC589]|jgi:YegS/Rv2252/BmrU family lipid kinase|uniref:diacylglycerol/lipid kinase family protein n=1 Tax=Gudongella sp. SC589 TaxID=3385990 RepID=UPI00390493AE